MEETEVEHCITFTDNIMKCYDLNIIIPMYVCLLNNFLQNQPGGNIWFGF